MPDSTTGQSALECRLPSASTFEQADTGGQFRSLMANLNRVSARRVDPKKLPFRLATHRSLQAQAVLSNGRDFANKRS